MRLRAGCMALLASGVVGCAVVPAESGAGLMDVAARPAEKALLGGIRAYEDAQYPQAESQLRTALRTGLTSVKDRAAAHKHLAFIYCSSSRERECEAEFRAARQADPAFTLSRSEAGHPFWGRVYQKVAP